MNIQIIATSVETKPTKTGKTYQQLEVTYKNLSYQGKTESKKLMSFGAQADAFKALADAQPQSIWEVDVTKNAQGYNDWTSAKPGNANETPPVSQSQRSPSSGATSRSTYETPEERAQRQVYIIRQSSVSAAVATLSVGAKNVKPDDVIGLADQYVDFVLNGRLKLNNPGPSGFEDFPDVPDFDVPEVK